MLWLTLWFTVVLKIPALYLCYVIWWAAKDPPPATAEGAADRLGGGDADDWPRRRPHRPERGRRPGPHGSPDRRPGVQPARSTRLRRAA